MNLKNLKKSKKLKNKDKGQFIGKKGKNIKKIKKVVGNVVVKAL